MATRSRLYDRSAPAGRSASTPASSSSRASATAARAKRFHCPAGSLFRRSANLAGRAIALSPEIPVLFDDPLAAHHRLIGRWVASRCDVAQSFTRDDARRQIERIFGASVMEAVRSINLVSLRIVVLHGNDGGVPAAVVICDSVGQLDLGWIETSDAPIAWRAAAYQMLETTLGSALPVFGYQDLLDEFSRHYWDGETDDEVALQTLITWHGIDPDDREQYSLPSELNARRPDWMIKANAGRLTGLPKPLRRAVSDLSRAHAALRRLPRDRNAWAFDPEILCAYLPGIEEAASLPPLTLVPVEQFAREIDDLAQHGMEVGFMDVAGICPLPDIERIDDWYASLCVGVRFLETAQALISLDPATL